MSWKLFATTAATIFLAEMGDKTQLATMSLSTSGSKWSVFLGSAVGLTASAALAVLAGEAISRVVPPIWIKRAAGLLFLVLGVVFLLSRPEAPATTSDPPAGASSS